MSSSIFFASLAPAAPSEPKKATKSSVELYNEAWDALQDLEFKKAEKLLRSSLKEDDAFAEAHNNLAYALRKQKDPSFAEALRHYNRAIKLEPKLAEAYMYRGVLHIQMGNPDLALEDHGVLLKMNPKLAAELEWVITNGKEKEPEKFFGVVGKSDK
ncbi:MAG: tetratricopeptide repeat protein [Verrucomicrobiota bacterium]